MLALTAVAASSATAAPARETTSFLIQASSSFQRLGDYWISDDSDYQGALAALGASSTCRLVGGDATHAVASWHSLGVTIELRTYGGMPAGATGCTAPDRIHVHTVRMTGKRWFTSLGLRVGDSVARLRQRYVRAKATPGVQGWYRRGYWLVTRRAACLGDCGATRFVTAPVLVAETRAGRVVSFVFVVGAEGE